LLILKILLILYKSGFKTAKLCHTHQAGGVVITNANGERLFMPAVGRRPYNTYILDRIGTHGGYWSSTHLAISRAANLCFRDSGVYYVGSNSVSYSEIYYNGKSNGNCVRCVAE
jgi:hypothetical protein